jgi:hypothetical protein
MEREVDFLKLLRLSLTALLWRRRYVNHGLLLDTTSIRRREEEGKGGGWRVEGGGWRVEGGEVERWGCGGRRDGGAERRQDKKKNPRVVTAYEE